MSEEAYILLVDQSSIVNNSESGLVLTGSTLDALIANSTISTNGFDGSSYGLVNDQGSVSMFGSLVTAIQVNGIVGILSTFNVKSCIVARNNQADLGSQDCAHGTEVVDLGANFVGNASCTGFFIDTDSYNILGELEGNGCEPAAVFRVISLYRLMRCLLVIQRWPAVRLRCRTYLKFAVGGNFGTHSLLMSARQDWQVAAW